MSFKSQEDGDFLIISFPSMLAAGDVAAVETEVKEWLLRQAKYVVLDLKETMRIEKPVYRPLLLLSQTLQKNEKILRSINVNAGLLQRFKDDGVHGLFNPGGTLENVKAAVAPKKAAFDIKFVNPFIVAAQSVLSVQAQVKAKPGKPYLKTGASKLNIAIAGVIAINSPGYCGSVALCFPAEVFMKVYETMLGEPLPTITPESQDAVAELLNIIFGQAKTTIQQQMGYSLAMAIPTVLVGEKLSIRAQARNQTIVLPFESDQGPFEIEIAVNAAATAEAA